MLPTIKQIQSAQWTTASPFALSGRMPWEACSFKISGGCQKFEWGQEIGCWGGIHLSVSAQCEITATASRSCRHRHAPGKHSQRAKQCNLH